MTRIDADLSGLAVSNTSRTYPNAAYGYMDDEIWLGILAGVFIIAALVITAIMHYPVMDVSHVCGSLFHISTCPKRRDSGFSLDNLKVVNNSFQSIVTIAWANNNQASRRMMVLWFGSV